MRGGLRRGLHGPLLLLALSAMVDAKPAARAQFDPKPDPPLEPTPPTEAARPSATVIA